MLDVLQFRDWWPSWSKHDKYMMINIRGILCSCCFLFTRPHGRFVILVQICLLPSDSLEKRWNVADHTTRDSWPQFCKYWGGVLEGLEGPTLCSPNSIIPTYLPQCRLVLSHPLRNGLDHCLQGLSRWMVNFSDSSSWNNPQDCIMILENRGWDVIHPSSFYFSAHEMLNLIQRHSVDII